MVFAVMITLGVLTLGVLFVVSLMSDLEDTYTDSEPDDSVQWKDQDFCAALYSGNKCWHRAQILSIKDDIIEVGFHYFTFLFLLSEHAVFLREL